MDEDLIISLHDPRGRVVWISAAPPPAKPEEVLGTFPWDWVEAEEKTRVKHLFAACLSLAEPQRFEAVASVHGTRMRLVVRLDPTTGPAVPVICRVRVVDPKVSLLTEKERQVLKLMARGHSSKSIARQLHSTTSTVDSHRSRAKSKLGLTTSAALAVYGARHLRD